MNDDFQEAWTPNGRVSAHAYTILVVGTIVGTLAIWAVFRPVFIPSPLQVLKAYPGLLEKGLVYQLYISLLTNVQATLISCLLTVPLCYLTVLPAVRPFVRGLAQMRFLGLTGFVILFTLEFGGGHALKVALLVFGMSVFLATTLYDVIESIPREKFDHARTLRMKPWTVVLEVVVFGQLDLVIDAVRQNAAMSWVMLTMVEGLVRFEGGLGAFMLAEDKQLGLAAVFALQLVVLAIGLAQDTLLLWLRRVLCPYSELTLERTNT